MVSEVLTVLRIHWLMLMLTSSPNGILSPWVRLLLSDTVVDNDGIIDRVAEDGQHNRDKVIVDWEAQQNKDPKRKSKYRAEVQSLPRCLPKRRQFF